MPLGRGLADGAGHAAGRRARRGREPDHARLRQLGARSATRRRRPPSSGSTSAPASTATAPPATCRRQRAHPAKGDGFAGTCRCRRRRAGRARRGRRLQRQRPRRRPRRASSTARSVPTRRSISAPLADKVARLTLSADGGDCAHQVARRSPPAATRRRSSTRRAPKNVVFWLTDDTRSRQVQALQPEDPRRDAGHRRVRQEARPPSRSPTCRATSRASRTRACGPRSTRSTITSSPRRPSSIPKFVTLPEAVKPTGRFTVGLMGNGFIDAFWGFGDGWDLLKNHIHEGGGLKAEDFVVEAKQILAKRGTSRSSCTSAPSTRTSRGARTSRGSASTIPSRTPVRSSRRASIRSSTRSSPASCTSPSATRPASSRSTTPTSATTISSSASS